MTLSEGLYHYFGQYVEIPLAALFTDVEPFTIGLVFSAVLVFLVFLGVFAVVAALAIVFGSSENIL